MLAAAAQPSEHLTVLGLPLTLTDAHVHAIFSQYGNVEQCKLLDAVPGMPSRGAIVQMATVEEASWLVQNVNNNIPSGMSSAVSVQFLGDTSVPALPAGLAVPAVSAAPSVDPLSALAALGGGGCGGWDALAALAALAPGALGGGGCGGCDALSALAAAAAPAAVAPAGAAPAAVFQVGVPMTGTVKRWDDVKGFGFIVPEGGGPDVFVHVRELKDGDKLINGAQVIFEAMQDPSKGPGRYRAKTCSGAIQKDSYQGDAQTANEKLFITGLPLEISEETITSVFNQYGGVVSVKKLPTQPGKMDAAALVLMGNVQQAKWLVDNVNGNIPTSLTQSVTIRFAENRDKGTGRGSPQIDIATLAGQAAYGAIQTGGFASFGPY